MKTYPIVFDGGPLGGAHALANRLPPALYFLIDEKKQVYVYVRSDAIELQYDWSEERSTFMSKDYNNAAYSITEIPQPAIVFHGA